MYKREKQYRYRGRTYAEEGSYFITICTKDRQEVFGTIVRKDGRAVILLSDLGRKLAEVINGLEGTYTNLEVGKWQIMPDHVHLILHLKPDQASGVEPISPPSLPPSIRPLVQGSISSIANHLKGKLTKWSRVHGCAAFSWQPRFHDRIIRNEIELRKIERYVVRNPEKWLAMRNPS